MFISLSNAGLPKQIGAWEVDILLLRTLTRYIFTHITKISLHPYSLLGYQHTYLLL